MPFRPADRRPRDARPTELASRFPPPYREVRGSDAQDSNQVQNFAFSGLCRRGDGWSPWAM